jgi:hypothetical protein
MIHIIDYEYFFRFVGVERVEKFEWKYIYVYNFVVYWAANIIYECDINLLSYKFLMISSSYFGRLIDFLILDLLI